MSMSTARAITQEGPLPGGATLPQQESESDLLDALGAGERAAADELVVRTYRGVYAACHRLAGGDAELAADLAQETYRKAWASMGSFHRRCQLGTWLYRIAYTTFLNHVRGPRRLVPLDQGVDPPDPAPSPHQLVAGDAEQGEVRRAVLGLPDDLRFTVSAHFWGELSVREIARQEGVTPVAIRKRLKKALRLLADRIEENER